MLKIVSHLCTLKSDPLFLNHLCAMNIDCEAISSKKVTYLQRITDMQSTVCRYLDL